MRKILFLLLSGIILNMDLFGQFKNVNSVQYDYCSSNKAPVMVFRGDTIIVECDTIYLVNKGRYGFYKNIHEATLSNKDSVNNKLLNAYESRLVEHQNAYDKLLINSKQSEKTTFELNNYTQNALANTQKTLDYTQKSLEQTLKDLELAKENIKKEKWNSGGKKLLAGLGGVAIGLIIGLLIN